MNETNQITREEHLQWCKQRAMEYVERGDNAQALASMGSDLNKHPETRNHAGMKLGLMQMMAGYLDSREEMAKFIRGFN